MVQRKLLSLLLLVMLLLEKNQACDKDACKIGLSTGVGAVCGALGGVTDGAVGAGCKVPATVVLSSTAGAAEYNGGRLGEFVEAGEHGGRPFYKQRDTEGDGSMFLYSEGGNWLVNDILGKSGGFLLNREDSSLPPTGTWEWGDGKKYHNDDTSLTLTFTTLSPCKMVRVTGRGEVVEKQDLSLGDYRLEVGRWSEGRPVYKKVDRERFLLVPEGQTAWFIYDSTTGTGAFIGSGRATNSPSSPEAGPSVRFGSTGWEYAADGGKWPEGDIRVTCL